MRILIVEDEKALANNPRRGLSEEGYSVDAAYDGEGRIKGDRDQLSELFLSVIDNAIKYNRKNGSVNISLTTSEKWAGVKVADSGIGITPDALNKVFDRFYRADISRSEVGKGSTFSIYLPVVQPVIG